jgi:hypothetical protein
MDELFRFSVVRATTKAQNPSLLRIATAAANPPRGKGSPAPTFQSQIQTAIQQLVAASETGEALWQRLEPVAVQWLLANAPAILDNALWDSLAALASSLNALTTDASPPAAIDETALQAIFDEYPDLVVAAVAAYQLQLADLFLALLIARRGGPSALARSVPAQNATASAVLIASQPTLPDVSQRLCLCMIVAQGAAALLPASDVNDQQTAYASLLSAALNSTVIVPPGTLSVLPKPVLGVGFRELNVVKQNIRRYQTAEIARIENILKGESRAHIQRHTLSTETDTTESETTTTETDKELTTDDHTSVSNQANSQVQNDTKLAAGVHAQYSGPSYKLQADLNVSYNNSDSETKQYSSNTAKDVTQKAVTKVTEVVTRTQTTKVIEAFYETESLRFDNTAGVANINGIYQWIEKVYLSQVFNLGRHMVIDITVPEPAANLLAMATSTPDLDPPPIQPHPLGTIKLDAHGDPVLDNYGAQQLNTPLNPLSLSTSSADPNFYGTWVAYYGATGVSAPPATQLTFSKAETFDYKDDDDKSVADQIQIADGYSALTVQVAVSAMRNDNPGQPYADNVYVDVAIGGTAVHIPWPNNQRSTQLQQTAVINPPATGTVNFTIYGHNIDQMSVNIELLCSAQQNLLDQWRLQTYEKIVDAYNTAQQTYAAAMAARKMETQSVGPLGSEDPLANIQTAQVELKRSCIAIFDNRNETVSGDVAAVQLLPTAAPNPPTLDDPVLPAPILDTSQALGARVRWFEQAFEWENMAYVLYPYFWGRRSRWIPDMTLTNDDPLFLQFLQAGYARVVVPVRLGFEAAVQFYLNTGLPWLGGDLPPVGDETQNPLYLDVAEEIKNLTGGGYSGEIEVPVGDPWEYVLPTTLIQLQEGETLPEWHREIPPAADPNDPIFASNAPDGPWTWIAGPPQDSDNTNNGSENTNGLQAAAKTTAMKEKAGRPKAMLAKAVSQPSALTKERGGSRKPASRNAGPKKT